MASSLMTASATQGLRRWHDLVRARDLSGLPDLLDPDVVFRSPVVHAPYQGREATALLLSGALHVLGGPEFRYVREVVTGDDAVLEFVTRCGDREVNGIDMIRFGPDGRIVDFTVMLRPLSATLAVKEAMVALLEQG
jgi:ketosteroid isomerase-like protein